MQSWFAKPSFWLTLMLVSGAADAARRDRRRHARRGQRASCCAARPGTSSSPGTRVEEADILDVAERAQAQLEFAAGRIVNLVGPGSIYVAPAKAGAARPHGARAAGSRSRPSLPGVRVRTAPFDVVVADGIVVMRAQGPVVDFFVEAGSAKLVEVSATGADGPGARREARRILGEAARPARSRRVPRAPRSFVDAMPRHFVDPLPALAARLKSQPALVVDHEITYAEAEPWLAGRDRAVFERRFTSRLRDPAFRSAVDAERRALSDVGSHAAIRRSTRPSRRQGESNEGARQVKRRASDMKESTHETHLEVQSRPARHLRAGLRSSPATFRTGRCSRTRARRSCRTRG